VILVGDSANTNREKDMSVYFLRNSSYLLIVFALGFTFDSAASSNRTWEPDIKKIYTLPLPRNLEDKEPVNVLAIDGGGIRGIIPARILQEFERKSGKSIAHLFDLVVGTSTGGILALALTTPDITKKDLGPKYSAEDMVNLYKKKATTIFDNPSLVKKWLWGPTYNSAGLEQTLKDYLGDMPLHFSLSNVVVTAVDIGDNNRLHVFSSQKAQENKIDNFRKSQVGLATSAAPTYFSPVRVYPLMKGSRGYDFIDGGLAANCPALVAYLEAERLFGKDRPINLISIGTGKVLSFTSYQEAVKKGKIEWGLAALSILFDTQTNQILNTTESLLSKKSGSKFYRFQPLIAVEDMDNTDPRHLNAMEQAANNLMLEKESNIYDAIGNLLKAHDKILWSKL
jgi:patatin-like phospholipase/acyl hydrolase